MPRYDEERTDQYLEDWHHREVIEEVCRCGEPTAFVYGSLCWPCWEAAGRPQREFEDDDATETP